MPEAPVCTCLTMPTVIGIRVVKVFDPLCQLEPHKRRGNYTGPLPAYEPKDGGNG